MQENVVGVRVACDRCRTLATTGEGLLIWWPDLPSAVADLNARGWEAGPTRQICRPCIAAVTCANLGHDLGPWLLLEGDEFRGLTGRERGVAVCSRCGVSVVSVRGQPDLVIPDDDSCGG